MVILRICRIIDYLEVQMIKCAVYKELFFSVERNSGNLSQLLSVQRSSMEYFVES
jgi:hypothetical protein